MTWRRLKIVFVRKNIIIDYDGGFDIIGDEIVQEI